jgi:8-oxo-dGTP diphosphatase
MARPRVAAGALFLDPTGRVLLVHPTYKDHWDIPGGYVEPGESPLQACLREVREELGISPPIGQLLIVDWAPAEDEGDKLLFIFDGGVLTYADMSPATTDGTEVAGWSFIAVEKLDQYTPGRLLRRIRAAIIARTGHRTMYVEHGSSPV